VRTDEREDGAPQWLKVALREEAAGHLPDRDRMLARLRAAQARPRRVSRGLVAGAAAAAVLAVALPLMLWRPEQGGTLPTAARGATSAPATGVLPSPTSADASGTSASVMQTPVSPLPTPRPAPATPSATHHTREPERRPTADPSGGRGRGPAPVTVVARTGPASNPYWSEDDLTLTAARPLTGLTVTVRVAQTGGVAPTGSWLDLPNGDFDVSVRPGPDALVYRWTLKPGRKAWPKGNVFAAQFDHPKKPRRRGTDSYTVTASAAGGRPVTVSGRF
jgi:hypothetical protein